MFLFYKYFFLLIGQTLSVHMQGMRGACFKLQMENVGWKDVNPAPFSLHPILEERWAEAAP